MTIHRRYNFEKNVSGDWQSVELEDVKLGDTIRFYDDGHLAFHQTTKATEWVVDGDMETFVARLIKDVKTSASMPAMIPIDADAEGVDKDRIDYRSAFSWIMARSSDGDMETLNKLFESYDPTQHSALFMVGLLRCSNRQKRLLPAWFPTLKKVSEALGERSKRMLVGMSVEMVEKELASEPKPDALGSLFDRQILNVHPSLIREG